MIQVEGDTSNLSPAEANALEITKATLTSSMNTLKEGLPTSVFTEWGGELKVELKIPGLGGVNLLAFLRRKISHGPTQP
jgi:hypothetical protein